MIEIIDKKIFFKKLEHWYAGCDKDWQHTA